MLDVEFVTVGSRMRDIVKVIEFIGILQPQAEVSHRIEAGPSRFVAADFKPLLDGFRPAACSEHAVTTRLGERLPQPQVELHTRINLDLRLVELEQSLDTCYLPIL